MRVQTVDDETRKAFNEAHDVRFRERLHAVLLSADGRSKRDIADILFCELERVTEWIRLYNDGGLSALQSPPASATTSLTPGPSNSTPLPSDASKPQPPSAPDSAPLDPENYSGPLSAEARTAIRECLRFSPKMYGRRSDFWSTSALAEVLRQRLGLVIPHEHVAAFLSQAGVARVTSRADLKKLEEKLAEPSQPSEPPSELVNINEGPGPSGSTPELASSAPPSSPDTTVRSEDATRDEPSGT